MYNKALNILKILENNGYESYIVGGYVRDKLLGIISNDIDIITSCKPNDISRIFNVDLKDNYGSVKLFFKGSTFEITTFRKESNYENNRWPSKIEFVTSLREDLKRRDFTINTICIDKDGNFIDLLNGINDLNSRLIRCVGDAYTKIKDDSLRILRALRFSCIYNFNIDDELVSAIKLNKDLICNLSFDRIKKELDIVFSSSNVNLFFNMIKYFDLYKTLKIKPKNGVIATNNYLSIWAQLDYSDDYNFTNHEKKVISQLKEIINNKKIDNYILYKYDINIVNEANKIICDNNIDKKYNDLVIKSRKDIDITYEEILDIIENKSIINKVYIDLEKQILYNKLNNKKQDIISYLEGDKYE